MTYGEWSFGTGFRGAATELVDLDAGKMLRESSTLIETGLELLDHILGGGLRPAEITTIGALSGHGKSALGEQIALHASKRTRTTYFGLELGRARTRDRMIAKLKRTDLASVQNLLEVDPEKLRVELDALTYKRNLILEERFRGERFDLDMLFRMVFSNKPQLIVIDHMRHLDDWTPVGSQGRADLSPAGVVRRLVGLVQETQAHIICVHQARPSAKAGSKPSMDDLADTRVLAQESDAVIMLHRPFRGRGLMDNVAELIVDKNRNGPEGIIHTHWSGRLMRYDDMTSDEEAGLQCCKPRK